MLNTYSLVADVAEHTQNLEVVVSDTTGANGTPFVSTSAMRIKTYVTPSVMNTTHAEHTTYYWCQHDKCQGSVEFLVTEFVEGLEDIVQAIGLCRCRSNQFPFSHIL
jgi:hypothetical protein